MEIVMGQRQVFDGEVVHKQPVYGMGSVEAAYVIRIDGLDCPVTWNGGNTLGVGRVRFSAIPKEFIEFEGQRWLLIRNVAARQIR